MTITPQRQFERNIKTRFLFAALFLFKVVANIYIVVGSGYIMTHCKRCGHFWEYRGRSQFYVTCPHCLSKVNLKLTQKEIVAKGETEAILEKSQELISKIGR